jgi:signal transduction histidine kinase
MRFLGKIGTGQSIDMNFAHGMFWHDTVVAQFLPHASAPLAASLVTELFSKNLVPLSVGGFLVASLSLAVLSLRRTRAALAEMQRRKGQLEFELNEVETALKSDSQILMVWRSGAQLPDRVTGSMHGAAEVPETLNKAAHFETWLEPDSFAELSDNLTALKSEGKAFNIGVKTRKGELLEADGRAAGSHATLRLRPLAGDRRQMTELSYDTSKLSKQVQRLSAMLDSAPFPAWIKDEQGKLVWLNRSYMIAIEAADLNQALRTGTVLFRDENLDRNRAQAAPGLAGRTRAVLKGSMRSFNIYEQKIEGGTSGFAVDMTALEEAEKELERHIKAHASTLDKIDTAIAIFGPDQRLRFFNQAYVELWKLEPAWLQAKPSDSEILDRLRASRSLPEQANFREWKLKQLSSYTTLEMREAYWYLPDGRSLHVICEQHPFGGVTYLYENLTKEYQLESRYNELFNTQRETLDNLAEAVALFGSDGRLKLYNPAFARLWVATPPASGQDLSVEQFSDNKRLSEGARAAWQDIRYGLTGLDGSRKRHDGQLNHDGKYFKYRAVPLPDGNTLITFTDVSDAVRAEKALVERTEALEAADKLKGAFLAHVSHEVRTPLTSISGFAEALDLGLFGGLSDKQRDYVLNIRRSADDLAGIIDAIIDLSAIDAGAMELKLSQVDVAEVLETAASRILPALERRDLSIKIDVAADVSDIIADRNRLLQILGHLLSNAIGFSSSRKPIHMGARHKGEHVQIWVADEGRGIEPEFQGKAFERFQSKPVPAGHRGPGLGLAIVKSFTELHGGKVSLASQLNKGTTVVCSFPITGPQGQDSQHRESPKAA